MKLSTAIQRGSRRQVLRSLAVGAQQPSLGAAPATTVANPRAQLDLTGCALGAAWHGLGLPASDLTNGLLVVRELSLATGIDLLGTFVAHPLTKLPMSLGGAVISLHTSHGWADDEIIGWLADLGY